MCGIILADGSNAQLHPITQGTSKQLVPVYDKPVIYYPSTILILSGIKDILVITTPHDAPAFHRLLGGGSQFGINLSYVVQEIPNGLAQAFVLGADSIGQDSVALVLGDNTLYGPGMGDQLQHFHRTNEGAAFAYHVCNPQAYGVVEFDSDFKAASIGEKPAQPKSSYAVPGLYFYDNDVVGIARNPKPSVREEYKTAGVNCQYLKTEKLHVEVLPRDTVWLGTGTFDSLAGATAFMCTVEKRQNLKVGCPEEAAWRRGFLSDMDLTRVAEPLHKSGYGEYLLGLLQD